MFFTLCTLSFTSTLTTIHKTSPISLGANSCSSYSCLLDNFKHYCWKQGADSVVKYTPDQIRKMEDSIRIRKASKPAELIKLVQHMGHNKPQTLRWELLLLVKDVSGDDLVQMEMRKQTLCSVS
ncbi:hypothetical protein LOK49_LG14G01024 [Camellia lanceoleosa]|uniref:Uncharacterized protein n=1 Tax=Camellia lanceoleosa TaxID=1840588 RepID=A0ACC0F8Z4_9ERIC|nr:hypothetical protein LOK49_LG14G01024 [Camellia lanceoleosa]